MKFIIDAYAWIEYLEGGILGEKVRKVLIENNEIYTLSLTISEVVSRVKRMDKNAEIAYKTIVSNSKIISVSSQIAKEAGLLHAEVRKKIKDFGLADSLILASSREIKAKILTGDKHFKGFKEAVLIT